MSRENTDTNECKISFRLIKCSRVVSSARILTISVPWELKKSGSKCDKKSHENRRHLIPEYMYSTSFEQNETREPADFDSNELFVVERGESIATRFVITPLLFYLFLSHKRLVVRAICQNSDSERNARRACYFARALAPRFDISRQSVSRKSLQMEILCHRERVPLSSLARLYLETFVPRSRPGPSWSACGKRVWIIAREPRRSSFLLIQRHTAAAAFSRLFHRYGVSIKSLYNFEKLSQRQMKGQTSGNCYKMRRIYLSGFLRHLIHLYIGTVTNGTHTITNGVYIEVY